MFVFNIPIFKNYIWSKLKVEIIPIIWIIMLILNVVTWP